MASCEWERLVTLVIPTVYHRAKLFSQALAYLDLAGFRGPILISDHSPPEAHGVIEEIIGKHPNLDSKLVYHDPSLHFLERLADCAERCGTPYFQLHADDDFLSRAGLERAVQFMELHSDYSACLGDTLNLVVDKDKISLKRSWRYQNREDSLRSRIIAQLMCYSSVLYALRRTGEVAASFRETLLHCTDVVFWQYLETMLCTVSGEIEVMNFPWVYRGVHKDKWSLESKAEPFCVRQIFPYILTQRDFSEKFCAFVNAVSQRIGIQDFYNCTLDTIPKEEKKFFIAFNTALPEFILGRTLLERTGKLYMEASPFMPSLGDLYGNCQTIQEYAALLAIIVCVKTGNHVTERIQFGKGKNDSHVIARI